MKILFYLGIISFFIFGGCTKNKDAFIISPTEPLPPTEDVPVIGNLSYLALGDSYTIGQSVEANQNFPNQLANSLTSVDKFDVSVKIIAQTGWTTSDLKNAIKSATLAPKYDFVTLLIGVNNQYRGYNIDIYREEFVELLQTSIKYAGGNVSRVFVLSIPDYSVTPFAGNNANTNSQIAAEIDAYNQINKEEANNFKVNYLNITPISREAKTKTSLIASDGLHPSAEMYQKWVKLLSPQVSASLK